MKNDEFSEILRLHGDMAFRMACHLTRGNESLARDLVQDAFVKIWKNWDRQRPDSFKGWLYRILHNLYMDHLRRQTREASDSYDAPASSEGLDLKEALPDHGPLLVETLEHNELKEVLSRALDQLPIDFRVPIVMSDIEGLSYAEIAQRVPCPIGTVRSRIHRGRQELRRILIPAVVAAATVLGAYYLSKAQQTFSSKIHIPVVFAPQPFRETKHAFLPPQQPSTTEKGESRDN